MKKNKISASRRRQLHEIVIISSVWMIAIFFCLKLNWVWIFAFIASYLLAQVITRIIISTFAKKTSPTPLSYIRIIFIWLLIIVINICCSLLMGLIPFGIIINYILLTIFTILASSLLAIWTIRW